MQARLTIAVILAVLAATWVAAACGGGQMRRGGQPQGVVSSPAADSALSDSTGSPEVYQPDGLVAPPDAIAGLDELPCPEGVDAELWVDLKDALKEALGKVAATPPTGESNQVNDFALVDHEDGSYTLTWHYRNLGDYGQDGKVGISDITPIAQHFGEEYDPEIETNSIQAVIDGSGNGKVDIADVTAIAQNYGNGCAAYSIRRSSSYPESIEDTTELDTLALEPEQWEERRFFNADFALPPYTYIAVAPVDGEGVPGELSNVRYTPNHQPVAALVADPTEGDAPLTVNLDASGSHDPDGPIAKYEWDWEGDGVWDEDTGAASVAQHKYNLARIYDPAVRVTDGSGAQDVASTTVTAGTWHLYTATDHTGYYTSLAMVNGNPGIAYIGFESGEYRLMYVSANDPLGTSWGVPVVVSEDEYDYWPLRGLVSLAVVNGHPAIASYFDGDRSLRYARAEDTNGGSWGGYQVIGSARCEPPFPNAGLTLRVVDGNPAAAYVDHETKAIAYNRALDPDGVSWGSFVVAVPGDHTYSYPVMALVNGRPAICYTGDRISYVRALDNDGVSWGNPAIFDSYGFLGSHSLAEVQTHPAIAYRHVEDTGFSVLAFVRASNANGSTWTEPIVLCRAPEETVSVGHEPSLAVINGRPAVAYINYYGVYDRGVMFVEARDAAGEVWREPIAVFFHYGEFSHCSLAEVEGHPAIAYLGLEGVSFAIYY